MQTIALMECLMNLSSLWIIYNIGAYLEDNLLDFYDKVEHLILKMSRPVGNKTLVLDFDRLKNLSPL